MLSKSTEDKIMEDSCSSDTESDPSLGFPIYDSKLMGEKRSSTELGEKLDHARRRVKMRNLESVIRSEDTHNPKSSTKHANDRFYFGEEEVSQVTKEPLHMNSDLVQVERTTRVTLPLLVDCALKPLDLNTNVCAASNLARGDTTCAEDSSKLKLLRKDERKKQVECVNSKGFGLDLNVEDVSSSANQDPFYPYKNNDNLKSRDVSECGSSTGPLEKKDPLKIWKEMKQNGFLSASHGGIPMPKQRGRKSKKDVMKKKMEIAKKEQVDRFTKMAAPSGLLNELNPGIINHVRNSKQVHSIIEALVRSEKLENGRVGSKQASQLKSGIKEISERKKDQEDVNDSRVNRPSFAQELGSQNSLSGNRQTSGYSMPINKSVYLNSEERSGEADSSKVERRICGGLSCEMDSVPSNEDDMLALKLSTSTAKALENASSISNEENLSSVSYLSVKAATVASQWLDLLHQDIKGRLAALRRSKKKVRAVIQTELPFLLSKEFSSNQENDSLITKSSYAGIAIADMHNARWSMLFDQMDKALAEEEKQLESWLNQVKEMQLHCERGLQLNNFNAPPWLQPLGASEKSSRSERVYKSEKELAVRAAAASIYSTCNHLLSMENVPCF